MIAALLWREWRGLFLTPFAWLLLTAIQALGGWLFIVLLEDYQRLEPQLIALDNAPGVTDLVALPLLQLTGWALLVLAPLITMGAISGERRQRTWVLLITSGQPLWRLVVAKYLAAWSFLLLLLALLALMPLALLSGTELDLGRLAAALLGLALLALAAAAVGLYASALGDQPATALAIALGLLLLLTLAETAVVIDESRAAMRYLSPLAHLRPFLQGLVRGVDIGYFLLLSAACLGLTLLRLSAERLR